MRVVWVYKLYGVRVLLMGRSRCPAGGAGPLCSSRCRKPRLCGRRRGSGAGPCTAGRLGLARPAGSSPHSSGTPPESSCSLKRHLAFLRRRVHFR